MAKKPDAYLEAWCRVAAKLHGKDERAVLLEKLLDAVGEFIIAYKRDAHSEGGIWYARELDIDFFKLSKAYKAASITERFVVWSEMEFLRGDGETLAATCGEV